VTGAAARFVVVALVLTGCAATPPGTGDGAATMARFVAARARDAQVVYLGESHDNPRHHLDQTSVLEAILAGGARPAVAFEMLSQEQQPAVEEAMAPSADAAALPEKLKWRERGWPDFTQYRPLFDLARRYGLPVVALDLDPPVVRRIAKGGLGALPADERSGLASRLPPDDDRERRLAREIAVAHCGLLPAAAVPSMVDAWHARNVTMARRIVQALDRVPQVVVIVGRGHQSGGGLPDQVERLSPGTRQLVVDLIEEGSGEALTVTQGRIAWPGPAVERHDPCAPLRGR
jgi:uncharacterized iron-regulated protein